MTETYRLAITISGKIDPDDRRGVAEQAEEWLDGLVYWINDTCPGAVWAELVAGGADGRVAST